MVAMVFAAIIIGALIAVAIWCESKGMHDLSKGLMELAKIIAPAIPSAISGFAAGEASQQKR